MDRMLAGDPSSQDDQLADAVPSPTLPVYLDEFVFRHNRRGTPMAAFQTLLGLGAIHRPTTYRQITRRAT